MRIVIASAVISALFACACGSSSSSGDVAPPTDAGADVVVENADASGSEDAGASDAGATVEAGDPTQYPAFTPDMAAVVNNGGAVLSGMKLVTVTWSADPNGAAFNKFGDEIGTSEFWGATSEYGLGVGSSGDGYHVVITDPPLATWSDSAVDQWLGNNVAAAPGNGWPVNDAQTVYMVYLPPQTALTSEGASACDTEEAYHTETFATGQPHIVYGIVIQACGFGDPVQSATEGSSHEIIEAATDPHTQSDLGWTSFDDAHYAYEVWNEGQDELADACESLDPNDQYYQSTDLPYYVQRFWSNKSAAAGKNPCVPNPFEPYFNIAPLDYTNVAFKDSGRAITAHAYHVAVGETATIHLGFYSDMKTDPWDLNVFEGDGVSPPPSPSKVKVHLDKNSGVNGDVATLTVTVKSVDKTSPYSLVTAVSTLPQTVTRYMPILIVSN